MNTAKLVNSALTGGGLIYPENLNVVIGSENKGYPKGTVLDANATLSLAGSNGTGNNNTSEANDSKADQLIKDFNIGKSTYVDNNSQLNQSLDFVQSFEKDKVVKSNIHISGSHIGSGNKYKYIPRSIGDVQLGDFSDSIGTNNLIIGESVANVGNYNILSSNVSVINIVNINGNDNLCLKSSIGKALDYLIKNKRVAISLKYAFKKDNNQKLKSVVVDDYNENKAEFIVITDFTRIDDNTVQINNNLVKFLKKYDACFIYMIYNTNSNTIECGKYIFNENANNSIFSGMALCSLGDKKTTSVSVFGIQNTVYNNGEFACGINNSSNKFIKDGNEITTLFSIGCNVNNSKSNCIEATISKNNDIVNKSSLYIYGIGGYNGANTSDDNIKSLQQVISDIQNNQSSTTQPVVDNGPWDVDITSKFIKGNVNISASAAWTINQAYKRVYLETKLNQGDVIKIPNTIRMYIGWKDTGGQYGQANWTQAGTTYTATVDGDYVILLDTPAVNNPGIEPATLSSFGKVMLHTSNTAFRTNTGGSSQGSTQTIALPKDHTRDDKVMRGIAHQGYHVTERANSLAAFRAAAKEGWRYVETDTYMTSDGKFIVSHDPYLPVGWTNGTVTTTQGSYKYEEHTLVDILAFHGPNNEKTDTLEEFCKTCKECGLHPYIEIKQGKMADTNTLDTSNPRYSGQAYCIKILDIVNRCGLRGNATFTASVPFTLLCMARKDQSYRYGIVYFWQLKNSDTKWTEVLSKIDEYNNDSVASKAYLFLDANIDNLKVADTDAVDKLVLKNCALEVWTAKTENDLNNLDPYVTGVTSDNIHAGEILAKKI